MRHLLAALILILLPLPALAADYPARVVGETDGDTLTVLRDGQDREKIWLAAIDAPETGQDFGSRGKQAASELAFGKPVTIREVDQNRYGRTVAEVILPGGRSLGREMVAEGMAWDYRAYSHDPALVQAEAAARAAISVFGVSRTPSHRGTGAHGKNLPVTTEVIGNRNSHVYHSPHCRAVAVMKPENLVEFRTAAAAEEKRCRRGGDCR